MSEATGESQPIKLEELLEAEIATLGRQVTGKEVELTSVYVGGRWTSEAYAGGRWRVELREQGSISPVPLFTTFAPSRTEALSAMSRMLYRKLRQRGGLGDA